MLNLDDSNAQLKVAQGTLSTRVRALPPGSSYEIDTPNLALGIAAPGDYRVDVAPDGSSTTVTVRNGSATVYGDGGQVPVAAGQQITFSGTNLQQIADNGAPGPDAFDQWTASRDAAEDRSVSARYVSRDVPGYQDLDANGTWRDDPQYGNVWVPNSVPADWAPYRDGHWVWQAPWGWTWVDDAPWGFAPYHYGRWAYVDNSWAWAPGPVVVSEPPCYAPALVAFVGGGDRHFNWGVNLAIGGAVAAGVAWFPLGPGEPWHPRWGSWSPHYYQRINQTVIVNNYNRNVNIHNTYVNYHAPGGVTAVPATAFVHGQPVGRFAQKVDPRQWHNAQINPGGPGIAPVRESFRPGMRNANYRPPANVAARPVVATRNPTVPAAYRDDLAQRFARGGGRVPGAGNPVVRTMVPAHLGNEQPQRIAGMPNVRVVQPHGPGAMPGGNPQATQRPGEGRPGEVRPNDGRPVIAGGPNGTPPMQGAPNGAQRVPGAPGMSGAQGQPRPGMPAQMTNERRQPGNGVPRPPQIGGNAPNGTPQHGQQAALAGQRPEGQQGQPRGEPAWMQPHTPMAQQTQGQAPQRGGPQQWGNGTQGRSPQAQEQAQQPQHGVPQAPGQPQPQRGVPQAQMQPQPQRGVPQAQMQPPSQRGVPQAQMQPPSQRGVPQAQMQPPSQREVPQAQMQPPSQREVPQAQMQPPSQRGAPPQPQAGNPAFAQQPRQEMRPPQPQQMPHPQPAPQQVQQAPRAPEIHAQPQPQPQPRPQPQPQPQPQPRPQPQQAQQPRPQPAPQQPHQPQQVQQPHSQTHPGQQANVGHEEHRRG